MTTYTAKTAYGRELNSESKLEYYQVTGCERHGKHSCPTWRPEGWPSSLVVSGGGQFAGNLFAKPGLEPSHAANTWHT